MKFQLLFSLIALVFVSPVRAQNPQNSNSTGTIFAGLTYATPIGNFRQKYPGSWAGGASVGALFKPYKGNPLEIGATASYLSHGIDLHDVGTGGDSYTLKTAHSFIPLHAVVRFKPLLTNKVVPYFDGLAGITVLNTRTKIKEPLFGADEEEDAIVVGKENNTVFSYGLGAGIQFAANKKRNHFIDLRVIYLEGSSARYVRRSQVTIDAQGNPIYKFTRSETNMILVQLYFTTYLTN